VITATVFLNSFVAIRTIFSIRTNPEYISFLNLKNYQLLVSESSLHFFTHSLAMAHVAGK
jgi:hypothetical protein